MKEKHKKTLNRPIIKSGRARNFASLFTCIIAACTLSLPLSDVRANGVVIGVEAKNTYLTRAQASRFLTQATMGATAPEINVLAKRIDQIGYYPACEEWIDNQFAIEPGETIQSVGYYLRVADTNTFGTVGNSFNHGWWHCALTAPDQLRFRTSFALSQIFVTSQNYWGGDVGTNRWSIGSRYLEKLRENAFSNYRNLLQEVTYDPLMGGFLSHLYNTKGDEAAGIVPDENYAREVMQLFSCGIYTLDNKGDYVLDEDGFPLENYDTKDVEEMAKVFTGFSLTKNPNSNFSWALSMSKLQTAIWYYHPMVIKDAYHDKSEKILPDGTVIPAGNTGDVDVSLALDWLAAHPSTAPHISRLLIKRFTSSNPSSAYIKRVTNHWYGIGQYCTSNEQGDMKAILKAILLDPEARTGVRYKTRTVRNGNTIITSYSDDPYNGRVKEPILKMTQFYRFCGIVSSNPDGIIRLPDNSRAEAQEILYAPSVFNFYASEHSPSSGPIGEAKESTGYDITAPEIQILSDYIITEFERVRNVSLNKKTGNYKSNHAVLSKLSNMQQVQTISSIVSYLDLHLCGGQMPRTMIEQMQEKIENSGKTIEEQIADAMALVISSPYYAVSR